MDCRAVRKELSPYLDKMSGRGVEEAIRGHLEECAGCRDEMERWQRLSLTLSSLGRIIEPDYLRDLIRLRLSASEQASWKVQLRDEWEYRWSRIRTGGSTWILIRVLGTAMTALFFFTVYMSMTPILIDLRPSSTDRSALLQSRQQLGANVLKSLGMVPVEAQKKPISPSDPRINDLYLLQVAQTASNTRADDSFSVVTAVDRRGATKIQNILEYPIDSAMLNELTSMLQTARCRPASHNGRAVDSHLVLSFSRISVYD